MKTHRATFIVKLKCQQIHAVYRTKINQTPVPQRAQ